MSNWEGYRKQHVVRKTFEELGCPDFWVDLEMLTARSWKETKEIFLQARGMGEGEVTPELEEMMEEQLADSIQGWNLTDPKTDEPLPVPTPGDLSSFSILPSDFIFIMQHWLQEQFTQAIPFARSSR